MYVSINEAAHRWGVGADLVRERIAAGELRAYRLGKGPGRAIRIKVSDLDKLLVPVVPDGVYDD